MRYQASRGGHAPGHLRAAFEEWATSPPGDEPARDAVRYDGPSVDMGELVGEEVFYGSPKPLRWLVGQLWNCTDVMPQGLCRDLDLPQGSTYTVGVRSLMEAE